MVLDYLIDKQGQSPLSSQLPNSHIGQAKTVFELNIYFVLL